MPPKPWRPIDLAALGKVEPVKPTICDLLYPGKTHLVSGEPETLKTLVLQAIGTDIVRNGGLVVLIDFEMGARSTLTRLRDLGVRDDELVLEDTNGDPGGWIYVAPEQAFNPDDGETYVPETTLDGLLSSYEIELVIIDSYTAALALHGYDPNSGADIENFKRRVIDQIRRDRAFDSRPAIVIIDHLGRNKENRGRFSIGSERKAGSCDIHLGLEIIRPLNRGGHGLVRVVTHKDREGFLARPHAAEIAFTSDPDTHALTWEIRPAEQDGTVDRTDTFRPTVLMERASRYLELQHEPVSRNMIENGFTGKRSYRRIAIERLVTEGYAEETADRLLRSVRGFRDTPSPPPESAPQKATESAPESAPEKPRNQAKNDRPPPAAPSPPLTLAHESAPPGAAPHRGAPGRGADSEHPDQDLLAEAERLADRHADLL